MNDFNPFDNYSDEEIDSDEETIKDNIPWIEKYRPKTLNDVASHDKIMKALKVFIESDSLPHVLFYGPPGTGKTSTIQAYARQFYGDSYNFMVMEINASEDRGIDSVRNKIKQFVSSECHFQKLLGKEHSFKLVILDEVDAMTEDAQSILRHVVDNYTQNARFCLICNYIKKIDPALQSRCTSFRFSPISDIDMRVILKKVASKEKIVLTKSGIETLIKRSDGDLRKMLNNLQSVSMIYDKIDEKKINMCFGYPQKDHIEQIIDSMQSSDSYQCYKIIDNFIRDNGLSLSDIIKELFIYLKQSILENNSIDQKKASEIIKKLRCIEVNQSVNSSDFLQISGTISCFKL